MVQQSSQLVALWWTATVIIGAHPLAGQSVQPLVYEETGTFRAGRLTESSGVAVSRSFPGLIWTHNDSGDRARIYATNLSGDHLGRVRVRGANAQDWEDMALGPCPNDVGQSCLYIADTGDNDADRTHGIIYIVHEPDTADLHTDSDGRTERAGELRVTYPDGPQDVEALAVMPDGDLLLISKGTRGPVVLYTISARDARSRSAVATARDTLVKIPARRLGSLVTAAAVSPSGQTLVVRTYTDLYFFSHRDPDNWELVGPPCWIGLRQPQGEAVDFLNETEVVLTTESAMGRDGGLARAVCPLPHDTK